MTVSKFLLDEDGNPAILGNSSAIPVNPNTGAMSEAFRHQCEVRYVASLGGKAEQRKYLDGVEKFRGVKAAAKLLDGLKTPNRPTK